MTLKLVTRGAVAALALSANLAFADITFTPTLASDYDFRGISLSARSATIQGQLDFSTPIGFKGYIFASNTDLGVPGLDTEVDFVAGWGGGEKYVYDVGIVYYTYPGNGDLNYPEFYAGVSTNFTESFNLGVKAWYSNDYAAVGDSGTYIEANGTVTLPWDGYGIALHVGRSSGKYWDNAAGGGYTDFSIGVTKSIEHLNLSLKLIDGSDLKDLGVAINSTDRKIVLGLSTTFPWK